MLLPDNPILAGCYPDPSICRVGDDYYLVTSTFEYFPGLPIFHSTDLTTWTQLGHALDRADQLDLSTVPSSGGLFAPTIRHHAGTWYLVCTVVGGEGAQGNFVLTARDPAGPWSDPIWIDDARGIDPSLLFDDGRVWLCGTRLSGTPLWHDQTEVWLRELDPRTLAPIGDEHVLWHGALIGAVWAEGPHLYRRGDWFYLLASEGGTEFNHALSVARSREITGPYEGFAANPVLTHRNLGQHHPIVAVGHADLVETPRGEWFAVLLASRPYGGYFANLGRETFAVAVEWQDDWPVFAPGVGQVVAAASPPEDPRMPPRLHWTQLRTADPTFAAVDVDRAMVTLRASPRGLDTVGTPSFLGVRQRHRDFGFGASVLPDAHGTTSAAIAVRQSEATFAEMSVRNGIVSARMTEGGRQTELGSIEAGTGTVRLEVTAAGQDYEFLAEIDGRRVRVAAFDGRFLSSQSAGGFLGVWVGLLAVGPSASSVEFSRVAYTALG